MRGNDILGVEETGCVTCILTLLGAGWFLHFLYFSLMSINPTPLLDFEIRFQHDCLTSWAARWRSG